jgi:hypothetical protein
LENTLITTSVWPPRTRDRSALAHAYAELLGWALFVGSERVQPGEVDDAFVHSPNAVLLAPCASFDAVSVPYKAAMDALLRLERQEMTPAVPCLLNGDTGTFLVEAGTGRQIAALGGVQITSGDDAQIMLPPTGGARWDTPPWSRTERMPLNLPSASDIRSSLADGLRLYPHETGVKS